MKFYSDMECNLTVWDGKRGITFIDGIYEAKGEEIDFLKKAGYRSDDDGRETIKRDTQGQEDKKEQTKVEIIEKLESLGIKFNPRDKKEVLAELLKG